MRVTSFPGLARPVRPAWTRRVRAGAAAAAGALLVVVPLAAPPALFARQALTMPEFTQVGAPGAVLVPLQRAHPAGRPGQATIPLARSRPAVTAARPVPGQGAANHRAASQRAASHGAASHRAARHRAASHGAASHGVASHGVSHRAAGQRAANHRAASHRAARHGAANHRAARHRAGDRRVAHLAQQGSFPAVPVLAGLGLLLFAPLALAGAAMVFRRRTAGGSPPGP